MWLLHFASLPVSSHGVDRFSAVWWFRLGSPAQHTSYSILDPIQPLVDLEDPNARFFAFPPRRARVETFVASKDPKPSLKRTIAKPGLKNKTPRTIPSAVATHSLAAGVELVHSRTAVPHLRPYGVTEVSLRAWLYLRYCVCFSQTHTRAAETEAQQGDAVLPLPSYLQAQVRPETPRSAIAELESLAIRELRNAYSPSVLMMLTDYTQTPPPLGRLQPPATAARTKNGTPVMPNVPFSSALGLSSLILSNSSTNKRLLSDSTHPSCPRDPTGPLLARPVRVSTSTSTDGSGSPNLCRFSTFPSPGGGYFNTADPYGGGGSGFYSPPAVLEHPRDAAALRLLVRKFCWLHWIWVCLLIDDNDALPNDRRIVVAEPDDFWSDWPQGVDIWRHVDAFLARKESGDIPESCYHLDFIPSVEIPALDNS
ncbi:hypothetical protein K438DRAFT_1779197 [Mycena galopus ATCC 62051]|nr:hypothetical protein K438DRAFT_1779197 [Mycena galopus ATCC 62051]